MLSCCITWHMPHCTVSNISVSVETVTAGTVTTAHIRTWTVGPCVTCKTKQNPSLNKVTILINKAGKEKNVHRNNDNIHTCTHLHAHVYYLYWHENTYVSHLQVGASRLQFDCKCLCLATRQVFHSFKFCTETFEEATHSKLTKVQNI